MSNLKPINIHTTAIVDDGAKIGEGTNIWHWVHVSAKAKIGKDCVLGQNVFVGNNVSIGNHVKVQNNVSIYDNVFIEDDVFCGPSMVFTNVFNPRAYVVRKNEYRDTIVKRGVTIGANATIICGVTLGEYCFIGAGALVNKNVKPFALVVGNPGRQIGWMSRYGEKLPLPIKGKGEFICEKSQKKYVLNDDQVLETSF